MLIWKTLWQSPPSFSRSEAIVETLLTWLRAPAIKGEVLLLSALNVAFMLLGGWLMAKEVLPMLFLALTVGVLTYLLGQLLTRPRRFSA